MSDDLIDTQPTPGLGKTEPNPAITHPMKPQTPVINTGGKAGVPSTPTRSSVKKKFPRWLVALVVVTLIAIGMIGGYGSGMSQRYAAQNTQVNGQLQEQYQLGQQAMQSGNYELAMQYFKFILQNEPNFPGIQAAYTDLLLKMQVSPTPAFSPTPEISPTPDMRGVEEIYNAAFQALSNEDWDGALNNLDSLRKTAPSYRTAEVDGMYYMALRQRGVAKITASCQDTNMEGGIYDLTLAEHFVGEGNLDSIAESLRTYARLYIIGASFWDLDWYQAQYFFGQVMTGYPNMSDSSCMTATKRWYLATVKYADQLMAAGDACGADEQYTAALAIDNPFNPTVAPTATFVYEKCHGGSRGGNNGPAPTTEGTPTETSTPGESPTEAPTCNPADCTPTGP
jgi:tetratricopeptide (TPR) repeat protein